MKQYIGLAIILSVFMVLAWEKVHAQTPPTNPNPIVEMSGLTLLITQDITQPAWVWSVNVPSCSAIAFAWNTGAVPWVQYNPVIQCDPVKKVLTATFLYSSTGRIVVLAG